MDNWRIKRISCDYYPYFEPNKELCENGIRSAVAREFGETS